jgi:hypothetical protein
MNWDPVFLLVFAGCNGTATGSFARYRGRSFVPWFVLGAFGWFLAIPWLFFTKPRLSDPAPPRGAALQSLVAFACAVVVFVANLAFAPAKLPHCDYYTNIIDLNKLVPDGRKITTITNIKEVSRSENDLRCTATAKLRNSTDVPIDYRFYISDKKLLSEIHWN